MKKMRRKMRSRGEMMKVERDWKVREMRKG